MTKITALLLFAFSAVASANEYFTFRRGDTVLNLNTSDIVVVVGTNRTGDSFDGSGLLNITMPGVGREIGMDMSKAAIGSTITGATKIRFGSQSNTSPDSASDYTYVVCKIIKPGQELISPPVVTPASADAKYVINLETSTDMQTWIPAIPGEYLGSSGQRFFRVRAVVKATP